MISRQVFLSLSENANDLLPKWENGEFAKRGQKGTQKFNLRLFLLLLYFW